MNLFKLQLTHSAQTTDKFITKQINVQKYMKINEAHESSITHLSFGHMNHASQTPTFSHQGESFVDATEWQVMCNKFIDLYFLHNRYYISNSLKQPQNLSIPCNSCT